VALFSISDDLVEVVTPTPFRNDHKEVDLQMWSAAYPHLLNNGQPMLSVGTEIGTTHGHAIDNLFIDGNGCLVVAELKRGKSPRDVTAQVIDYATYIDHLEWVQIEEIWDTRNDDNLGQAYRRLFGYDLNQTSDLKFRLLIVAESFDPSVQDAAAFLLGSGIDLAMMSFNYFQLEENKLLDMKVVLGEVPVQHGPKSPSPPQVIDEARDGYRNWLIRSIRERLPVYARERGIDLMMGSGVKDLTFAPDPWPFTLGEVRFLITGKSKEVGLYFSYLNDREPPGFFERLEEAISSTNSLYDVRRLKLARTATTLSHSIPLPEMGDLNQVDIVIEKAWKMVDLIAPIVVSAFDADNRNSRKENSENQAGLDGDTVD